MDYEGNPSRRHWLNAQHPFGGYTADKQRAFLAAWHKAEHAKPQRADAAELPLCLRKGTCELLPDGSHRATGGT